MAGYHEVGAERKGRLPQLHRPFKRPITVVNVGNVGSGVLCLCTWCVKGDLEVPDPVLQEVLRNRCFHEMLIAALAGTENARCPVVRPQQRWKCAWARRGH